MCVCVGGGGVEAGTESVCVGMCDVNITPALTTATSLAPTLPTPQTSVNNQTIPGETETILVSIQRYDDTRWETSMTSTLRLLDSNLDVIGTKKILPTILGEEVSTSANRSNPLKLNAITAGNILMFEAMVSYVTGSVGYVPSETLTAHLLSIAPLRARRGPQRISRQGET